MLFLLSYLYLTCSGMFHLIKISMYQALWIAVWVLDTFLLNTSFLLNTTSLLKALQIKYQSGKDNSVPSTA